MQLLKVAKTTSGLRQVSTRLSLANLWHLLFSVASCNEEDLAHACSAPTWWTSSICLIGTLTC